MSGISQLRMIGATNGTRQSALACSAPAAGLTAMIGRNSITGATRMQRMARVAPGSMRSWRVVLLAALFAASCPLFAQADATGTPQEEAACRPDVRKFCHSVKPGSGALAFLSCLQANRSKLSKACLAVLTKHGQ